MAETSERVSRYKDWKLFPDCIIVVNKSKSEIHDEVQTYFNESELHITPSTTYD